MRRLAGRSEHEWQRVLGGYASGALVAASLAACAAQPGTGFQAGPGAGGDAQGALDGAADGAATDIAADVPPVNNDPIIDLVVDADRNGVVDPAANSDQVYEDFWDHESGASLLANLDDDDGDKLEDAFDGAVNGEEDSKDLARIRVAPWAKMPEGATGEVALEAEDLKYIRVFRKVGDAEWDLVAGSVGACSDPKPGAADCKYVQKFKVSSAEILNGAEFGIESRQLRMETTGWDGYVRIGLTVRTKAGVIIKTPANPDDADFVTMRVAPWMLFGNHSVFDKVRSDSYHKTFVADLEIAVPKAGIKLETYKGWNDQWTQDFYQTGWTSIPAPDGKVQGMRIGNARPYGRAAGEKWLPITWLRNNYLGPDHGILAVYKKTGGTTYDSHGNHDLLPPYVNGDATFPSGRIITGSGVLKETMDFYAAQLVQGPPLVVETKWLIVGHVDEVLSYVPADTPRGWKLLIASDDLCKDMYEQASKAGYGQVEMFVGKFHWYKAAGNKMVDAATSIDEALDDQDLMQWSQEAGVKTEAIRKVVVAAVGLADDEIIPIPFLTEKEGSQMVAWNPGTVNSLVYGNHIAIPNPFGPIIKNEDMMAKDLKDRLGTDVHKLGKDGKGLGVHFVDDFMSYHVNLGEVHCGTNAEGPAQLDKWWEVVR